MFRNVNRFGAAAVVYFSALNLGAANAGQEFSFSFEWGNIPRCTSGDPNMVDSPKFVVVGLPKGTKFIEFVLVDLDVPDFEHGGGIVPITEDGVIKAGAFQYLSPCPPDGAHEYEWAAFAIPENSDEAETLAEAYASKFYPE